MPTQRRELLDRISGALRPGGRLIFDVPALQALDVFVDAQLMETNLMDGFWASDPYLGLKKSFKYAIERISLDRYLIV